VTITHHQQSDQEIEGKINAAVRLVVIETYEVFGRFLLK